MMKRIKLCLTLLLIVVLCCACGNPENNQSNANSTLEVFEVDGEKLENEGYIQVVDVLYGKIVDGENGAIIRLACCKNMPNICMYIMYQISEGIDYEFDKVVIDWNGTEYEVNQDAEGFPPEWQEVLDDMIEKGYTVDSIVSASVANGVQGDIDDIVDSYLSTKETSEKSEIVSSEETSISTEAERKEVKKEVYEIEEMEITMNLSQDSENAMFFSIGVQSEVAWKLAYSFFIYNGLLDLEELNPVIMAYNDEVLLSTTGFSMMRKEGTLIDAGEWCAEQVASDAFNLEEAEVLGEELQNIVLEFLELNQ